jgi:hypothetical protein
MSSLTGFVSVVQMIIYNATNANEELKPVDRGRDSAAVLNIPNLSITPGKDGQEQVQTCSISKVIQDRNGLDRTEQHFTSESSSAVVFRRQTLQRSVLVTSLCKHAMDAVKLLPS